MFAITHQMSKAALVVTIAFVAVVSVGGIAVCAQVAEGRNVVAAADASADSVTFLKLNVIPDPLTLWPVKGLRSATARVDFR